MAIARNVVVVSLVAAAGMVVSAEQRGGDVVLVRPPVSSIKFVGTWRPDGAGSVTRVVGSIVDVSKMPVPFAHLQLRDLKSGAVVAVGESNDRGEYEFTVEEPGTFVVEMVVNEGQVIAVSNAGLLPRYQTLQTWIQLSGRWNFNSRSMSMPVSPTAFFGFGAARSLTSSTIALAADAQIRPMDVGEPVSPQ